MIVALAPDGYWSSVVRRFIRVVEMYEVRIRDEHRRNTHDRVVLADKPPGRSVMCLHSHRKDVREVRKCQAWAAVRVEVASDQARRKAVGRVNGMVRVHPHKLSVEQRGIGCPQRVPLSCLIEIFLSR